MFRLTICTEESSEENDPCHTSHTSELAIASYHCNGNVNSFVNINLLYMNLFSGWAISAQWCWVPKYANVPDWHLWSCQVALLIDNKTTTITVHSDNNPPKRNILSSMSSMISNHRGGPNDVVTV